MDNRHIQTTIRLQRSSGMHQMLVVKTVKTSTEKIEIETEKDGKRPELKTGLPESILNTCRTTVIKTMKNVK